MQSKFNFSLSLLNDFPFLFSSILSCSLTISFDISCAFSLCIGYCLIINVACSEHAGVSVCVNVCVGYVCECSCGWSVCLYAGICFVFLFLLIFSYFSFCYLLLTQKLIIFKQLFVNLF